LQVVENWNSANSDLFYGNAGTIGGTDRENQEVSMLALHLLQSALVLVNTILIQSILKDPEWAATPTPTGAPCPRCSGHTPTCAAPSRSTWTPTSTSA
jgi:TnpA family transposase